MKFMTLFTYCSLITMTQATTVLVETTDFSDDFNNPTVVPLMIGDNFITFTIGIMPANGSSGNGAIGTMVPADADFFLFRLPQGTSIPEIRVTENERGAHFFGAELLDPGLSTFSVTPGETQAFQNALDASFVFSGTGSNLALQFVEDPDRDFIALFQETDDDSTEVTIRLTVVPEPSTTLFLTLSTFGLLCRRRR